MSKLIPTDFIDSLLSSTAIEDVVGSRVSLSRNGNEYRGLCPFHEEKTPSFTVTSSKQFYFCFGCKESGNTINFLMKYEGVSFRDAVEILADHAGLVMPQNEPSEYRKKSMALATVLDQSEQAYGEGRSNVEIVDKYLSDCGILDSTCERYSIGYSSESAVSHIHTLPEELIVDVGLATKNKNSLKHWANNKLILGVRGRRGSIRGFIAQPMNATKPVATKSSVLFDSKKNLFGMHEAHDVVCKTDTIIVVERPLEVLALHSHGVQCAISTINSVIDDSTLESVFGSVSNVVFCFSSARVRNDAFDATLKVALGALREGRDISFVILPGQTRNCAVYLKLHGSDAFHELVDTAKPAVDILFRKLSANRKLSGEEKQEWVHQQGLIALSAVPSSLYRRLAIKRFEYLSDSAPKTK